MRVPAGHRIIISLIITFWHILPPVVWRIFSQLTSWITGGLLDCWIGRSELVDGVWLGWTNHVVGHTFSTQSVKIMVLILDGNSEIGAHVRSNLSYLIC